MNNCEEKQLRDAFCKIRPELDRWGEYLDDILNKYVGNQYPNIKESKSPLARMAVPI